MMMQLWVLKNKTKHKLILSNGCFGVRVNCSPSFVQMLFTYFSITNRIQRMSSIIANKLLVVGPPTARSGSIRFYQSWESHHRATITS